MTNFVRLISAATELSSLEAAWNALSEGMPLRSYDWLATWWKHYGLSGGGCATERQLFVLAVYRKVVRDANSVSHTADDRLLGIAPWYLDRIALKGNVLRWLGSGEVCTDHVSIICRPEDGAEVAAAIAKALTTERDEWDQLELNAVDESDPVVSAAASVGWRRRIESSSYCRVSS